MTSERCFMGINTGNINYMVTLNWRHFMIMKERKIRLLFINLFLQNHSLPPNIISLPFLSFYFLPFLFVRFPLQTKVIELKSQPFHCLFSSLPLSTPLLWSWCLSLSCNSHVWFYNTCTCPKQHRHELILRNLLLLCMFYVY